MSQPDPDLERARKHVKDVRDFLYHLMVYVLVIAMLVVVDLRQGGIDFAFWVALFWAFGLAGHAIYAFFDDYRAYRMTTREKPR